MDYTRTRTNGSENTTLVFSDGNVETISESHLNYRNILNALESDRSEEDIKALTDAGKSFSETITRLSERVSFKQNQITFDGDVINTALSNHILRMIREGSEDCMPFVKLMENLAANPSAASRHSLFNWLESQQFTINEDGFVVGYKSVEEGSRLSWSSGVAEVLVNGEKHVGRIPNPDGALVEIPRSQVDDNRRTECSYGLHVGTYSYANYFGRAARTVLKVLVNPRDVVSVPTGEATKMRVCRYRVEGPVEDKLDVALDKTEPAPVESSAEVAFTDDESSVENPTVVKVETYHNVRDSKGRFTKKS